MKIKVCYFANLRETLGRSEDTLQSEREYLTATEVWTEATGQKSLPDKVLIALNHEYVDAETKIREGDEIAFFPPVTGG